MKRSGILNFLVFTCFALPITANAGNFDWLDNLNIKAETDASGYQVTLATRFRIGNAEARAVISNTEKPADAYMVLRLSELANCPVNEVLKVYESDRNKGWGVMAKHLGIQPGSKEFHVLKRGHDLDDIGGRRGKSARKSKGKARNKG